MRFASVLFFGVQRAGVERATAVAHYARVPTSRRPPPGRNAPQPGANGTEARLRRNKAHGHLTGREKSDIVSLQGDGDTSELCDPAEGSPKGLLDRGGL